MLSKVLGLGFRISFHTPVASARMSAPKSQVLANSFIGTENSVLAIALEDLAKLVFKSLARRSGGRPTTRQAC